MKLKKKKYRNAVQFLLRSWLKCIHTWRF